MNCPRCGATCVELAVFYCKHCDVGWVTAPSKLSPMPAVLCDTVDEDREHLERCYRLPSYKKRK
jgi:hypothetical protein